MSQQDYHDAIVEAADEAIEQGWTILAAKNGGSTEFVARHAAQEKPRTLGDLLREAIERGLPEKFDHAD